MKNQSYVTALALCLTLAACSSNPKKETPPASPAPATSTVSAAGPAIVDPGGGTDPNIPTSGKTLTPVIVPTDDTLPADTSGGGGPAITLKPDPKNPNAAKVKADSKVAAAQAAASMKTSAPGVDAGPETTAATSVGDKTKPAKPAITGVDPSTSLRWLKNGNTRFAKGWLRKDGATMKDIKRVVTSHRPHAIVLASSDARVPPELVFDQKLGEIFTVRTLGPSLSPEVIGTMEYAILNLGTRHIVVLGHSSCGGAKIAYITMDGSISGGSENLKAVVNDIQPRVKPLVEGGKQPSKNFMAECWANTTGIAKEIAERSSVIKEAMDGGQLAIHSGLYDLETGKVEFR